MEIQRGEIKNIHERTRIYADVFVLRGAWLPELENGGVNIPLIPAKDIPLLKKSAKTEHTGHTLRGQ
jgi:hypothetical protein